ncbi:MAG: sensor histidine kinase [Proteobacteria bacterium]|nr:sensor histidine kinase [Pseudomonadota bacterium]
MKIKSVRYVLLILLFSKISVFAQNKLIIPDEISGKHITEYLEIYEDKTGALTFDDIVSGEVSFSLNENRQIYFGLTTSTFWIKVNVTNASEKTIPFYFEFVYPLIDELDFYYKSPNGESVNVSAGDARPVKGIRTPHHTPRFLVEQQKGDQSYFFKIRGEGVLKSDIKVWDKETFENRLPADHMMSGIAVGILFSVILYNLITFLWQRRWIYFWFACFATSAAFHLLLINGIGFQLLSPHLPYHGDLFNYLYIINLYLSTLFCLLFFYRFKTEKKIYHTTLKVLLTIAVLIGLVFLVPGYRLKVALICPYQAVSYTICFLMFVYCFFRYRPFFVIIAGMTLYLVFIYANCVSYLYPQIISWMSFMMITIGMVIHSNAFNLEQQGLMLSIQQAENVKSEFIHSVAHNLKTPLVALTFSSQMLKNILKDHVEAQHFLDKILRNATWLSNFIENFFEFYKNDKFELNIKPVDMKMLVNSIVGELADINRYRHNILFNQSESDDDFFVNIDKSIVEQVLLNVVENAIKYSTIGNEKGTIIINMEKNAKELIISIADNGIGISKKSMEKIYNAFFRENKDDQYGGTGLGLTISKKFIDAHKGEIYCVSPVPTDHSPYLYLDSERKGTVFFIHLPTNLKKEEEDK